VAQAARPAFLLFPHVVNDILLPLVLAYNTKLVARPAIVGGASSAGGVDGNGGGDGVVATPPLVSVATPECAHFPATPGCEDYYHSAEVIITITIITITIVSSLLSSLLELSLSSSSSSSSSSLSSSSSSSSPPPSPSQSPSPSPGQDTDHACVGLPTRAGLV
jgi:hypothetical protein